MYDWLKLPFPPSRPGKLGKFTLETPILSVREVGIFSETTLSSLDLPQRCLIFSNRVRGPLLQGPTENRQGEWAPWLNIIITIIIIIIVIIIIIIIINLSYKNLLHLSGWIGSYMIGALLAKY